MRQADGNKKIYHSEINEKLKVVWADGKKLLNTKNTNYSYGGLQEVLERGLRIIPIQRVESTLVLGMGGGSVVDSLRNKLEYDGPIIGIEIDLVVIDIAKKEYNIHNDPKVQIVQADANEYVAETRDKFDLIVVDIFIDDIVPEEFYLPTFWNNIESITSDNGFVLFNAGIDLPIDKMYEFLDIVPDSFIYTKKLNVLVSNTVFIFQKVF